MSDKFHEMGKLLEYKDEEITRLTKELEEANRINEELAVAYNDAVITRDSHCSKLQAAEREIAGYRTMEGCPDYQRGHHAGEVYAVGTCEGEIADLRAKLEAQSNSAQFRRVEMLESKLEAAHEVFGHESDKLGATIKALTEQNGKMREALELSEEHAPCHSDLVDCKFDHRIVAEKVEKALALPTLPSLDLYQAKERCIPALKELWDWARTFYVSSGLIALKGKRVIDDAGEALSQLAKAEGKK